MRLRRLTQALCLILFLALFLSAAYGLIGALPHDLFLRLDPLVGLLVILLAPAAAGTFALALVVGASALLMGRAFCGHVCPLGTVLDVGAWVSRSRREVPSWASSLGGVKQVLLVILLLSGLLGFSLLAWVDPLVLLTRNLALLLDPWIRGGGNVALDLLRPFARRMEWVVLANTALEVPQYWLTGLSGLWIGAIVGLSLWRSRLWCRILCPLGALLGTMGRWAPLRRRVTDACIDCGACQGACPVGAIGQDPQGTAQAECIRCRRCAHACPSGAIRFLPVADLAVPSRAASPALSRRGLLAAGATGLFLGLTSRVDAGRSGPRDRLVRPPGAIPEEDYLDQCLRCGLCMGTCMSHTLQPTLWEAGLDGVWTPRLDLRLAPCEKHCNRCGQVCPTGAIRPLPLDERTYAKIGTAILLRDRCLVWEQDKVCLVCDEICPYDAIEFREVEGKRRPFVTENRCNGCGYCEHKCPVQGESAIIVSRAGELRLATGSYIEEAKARGLVFEGAREEATPAYPYPSNEGGGVPKGFLQENK